MEFKGKEREANLRELFDILGIKGVEKWLNPTDDEEDTVVGNSMHKEVLSKIDFELSDEIWKSIDAGFRHYWDIEVGYGNYLDFDNACSSIYNHLKMDRLILSLDKLETIVNIMFDIMENTPGMILDDSDVVIPRKH